MMPEMDGFEFISHLREKEAWQTIPVVVLTAKDITPEEHLRLQGNVRKVFLKASFSRDELVEEIRAAIEHHRPAETTGPAGSAAAPVA
jgi:DNA-binding response OmpR family regulator